jgi:hypothetical protein
LLKNPGNTFANKMPVDVIAHDTRLEDRTPVSLASAITIEVDDEMSLRSFVDRLDRIAEDRHGIGTLYILAQGETDAADDSSSVMFCHDQINDQTVNHFARLGGKVESIVLLTTHEAGSGMNRHGDGEELCRQIALITKAEVTAARNESESVNGESRGLTYCDGSALEFGEWEGPVVVYGANGYITAEYQNSGIRRDQSGMVQDPRIELAP